MQFNVRVDECAEALKRPNKSLEVYQQLLIFNRFSRQETTKNVIDEGNSFDHLHVKTRYFVFLCSAPLSPPKKESEMRNKSSTKTSTDENSFLFLKILILCRGLCFSKLLLSDVFRWRNETKGKTDEKKILRLIYQQSECVNENIWIS